MSSLGGYSSGRTYPGAKRAAEFFCKLLANAIFDIVGVGRAGVHAVCKCDAEITTPKSGFGRPNWPVCRFQPLLQSYLMNRLGKLFQSLSHFGLASLGYLTKILHTAAAASAVVVIFCEKSIIHKVCSLCSYTVYILFNSCFIMLWIYIIFNV